MMAEAELLGLKPFIVKESSSGILLKPEAKTILDKHGLKYEYNPELGDKLIFLPYKQNPNYVLQMSEQMDNNRPFMGPKDTTNKYLLTQMDSSNNNTISRNNTFVNTNGQMRQQMGKRQIKIYLDNQDIDEILEETKPVSKRTTTIYVNPELWAKFTRTVYILTGSSENRSLVIEKLIKAYIKRAAEQYPWIKNSEDKKNAGEG